MQGINPAAGDIHLVTNHEVEMDQVDTAMLILRVWAGTVMIAHGINHGRSLDGTANWFGKVGFKQPRLNALLSAGLEVAVGLGLSRAGDRYRWPGRSISRRGAGHRRDAIRCGGRRDLRRRIGNGVLVTCHVLAQPN